jgi:hypothetical protein
MQKESLRRCKNDRYLLGNNDYSRVYLSFYHYLEGKMNEVEQKINATILGIVYHPEIRNLSDDCKKNIADMVRILAKELVKNKTKDKSNELL